MTDHGARLHAQWSASATERNWLCAGALTLAPYAPAQKESIHAATGTACHQIGEKCLRTGVDAVEFIGSVEKTKEFEITIGEEEAASAQEYVDYCRSLYDCEAGKRTEYWIEEKLSLADIGPPFEAGGTGDFVAFDHDTATLHVVDLKNGKGIVDVNENKQLRSYGLGAVLKHTQLPVDYVTVTIVQPRAPHKDGRIRSETFHVADLAEWTAELLKAMRRSKQAMDEHETANGNSVLLDEWADKWLTPGACKFCPAEGSCPALRKKALEVAAVWFDADTQEAHIGNSALDTSPEAIARDLALTDMLESWIAARWSLAKTLAEQGTEIPGYILVDKVGNRKWAVDDAQIEADLTAKGLAEDDIYERKLKSPAQLEKGKGGAERKKLIAPLWHRPVTGQNLVSAEKTTRSAARPAVDGFLEK